MVSSKNHLSGTQALFNSPFSEWWRRHGFHHASPWRRFCSYPQSGPFSLLFWNFWGKLWCRTRKRKRGKWSPVRWWHRRKLWDSHIHCGTTETKIEFFKLCFRRFWSSKFGHSRIECPCNLNRWDLPTEKLHYGHGIWMPLSYRQVISRFKSNCAKITVDGWKRFLWCVKNYATWVVLQVDWQLCCIFL